MLLEPSANIGQIVKYPPKNANEDPKNAGILPLVIKWNNNVPRPANNNVVETSNPVNKGTSTVAPNIANKCWKPKTNVLQYLIL